MSAEIPPFSNQLKEVAFTIGKEVLRSGEIPSISVYGRTLPEAWERSVLATWEFGTEIPTEYDQDIDPNSRDASVFITVASPFAEPRIHKAMPAGYDDLLIYTEEVVNGVHDGWVGQEGWSYSYHDRAYNWPGRDGWQKMELLVGKKLDLPHTNQINALIQKLSATPFTRRAQAVTWVPWIDKEHHEPPCLQRIWCRVVRSSDDFYLLEMNTNWRSRDALKAAFMNMFALTELQRKIAGEISALSGRKVEPGRYLDFSDSYHIYGSYLRKGEIGRFINSIGKTDFSRRIIGSDDPLVLAEFERGRKRLEEEVRPKLNDGK